MPLQLAWHAILGWGDDQIAAWFGITSPTAPQVYKALIEFGPSLAVVATAPATFEAGFHTVRVGKHNYSDLKVEAADVYQACGRMIVWEGFHMKSKPIKVFLSAYAKAREERLAREREEKERLAEEVWREKNRRDLERRRRLTTILQWLASHRQRVILAVAATLYIISVLFAPWVAKGSNRVLMQLSDDGDLTRFGAIFSSPHCAYAPACHYELNVSLLLIEWLFIAIMIVIAWLWSRS